MTNRLTNDRRWELAEAADLVRYRVEPDCNCDPDNLEGTMFCPKANPDIDPEELERNRKDFWALAEREGVWGIIGEYRTSTREDWVHADSCWGFVGEGFAGYDDDCKS